MNIFISYASVDLDLFRIPEIANYLESQAEIEKVYYWEHDNDSTMTIVQYMEQSILESDIILVMSSQRSLQSEPVNRETDFAVIKSKRFIPIFQDIADVREFLRQFRGVTFDNNNFDEFLPKLMSIIKGDHREQSKEQESVNLNVQKLFDKFKNLTIKLFKLTSVVGYAFASKLLRSEEMQEFFGITVRDQENLDDQKIYFLDGLYYIIPNSKTLRIKNENGKDETLLTRNNLNQLSDDEKKEILNSFFMDIVSYVKEETNNIIVHNPIL